MQKTAQRRAWAVFNAFQMIHLLDFQMDNEAFEAHLVIRGLPLPTDSAFHISATATQSGRIVFKISNSSSLRSVLFSDLVGPNGIEKLRVALEKITKEVIAEGLAQLRENEKRQESEADEFIFFTIPEWEDMPPHRRSKVYQRFRVEINEPLNSVRVFFNSETVDINSFF